MSTRSLATWFMALACADRYFSSCHSARRRQLSSVFNACCIVIATTGLILLLYVPILIYFDIDPTQNPICYGRKGFYRIFADFFYLACYSLCPTLVMVVFGVLTITNVRKIHRQVSTTATANVRLKRKDRQLILMLLFQVIVIIVTILPLTIQKLYATFTANNIKSPIQVAYENLALQIIRSVSFMSHCLSFYIFTLVSDTFRRELVHIYRFCSKHAHITTTRTTETRTMTRMSTAVNRTGSI
ncbi:unnamed protein product [Didymodactylos carnosus]|uniref:G-protein coupled receptors family 1 profile domain-containing protein n=1 Tax=Didymodactylos carnosus TaxID=1234261 RepID=A0A814NZX5_9BILA|nr:unnamed protein product [Didymodactylos carnosus]CAF1099676.1 unnamed protein product [Didymodactylos carnosus]CAF3609888.1 unnamed protein product [Didymodactylos carnosus]CAF3864770.1 unnamed protein product [Didymodactylos carnosus]